MNGRDDDTGRPLAARHLLLLAVFLGLVAGLWEVGVVADRSLRRHEFVFRSWDTVWTSPLGHVFWMLCFAAALFALGRLLPRLLGARTQVVLMLAVGAFAIVLHLRPVAGWGKALLAVGVGVQGGRLLVPRTASLLRWARRGAPVLGALVLALAVGIGGRRALAEREALDALPAAAPDRPNVLLVVLDTVRAQSLSLHGHDRETSPNLERLAAEGVMFEHAITTAPWTLPSHAAMFTGRWHHEVGTGFREPLDGRHPTLSEALGEAGYATAGFVGNVRYCGQEVGLARGFAHYEDYVPYPGEILFNCATLGQVVKARDWFRRGTGFADDFGRKPAERVNAEFLEWLDEDRPRERPFFAFLNYYDAHHPYLPPPGFAGRWGNPEDRRVHDYQPGREGSVPERALAAERDAYECAVAYVDDRLGALVAALRERGVLDDTVVVVTSDHGETFGEHRSFGHTDNVYVQTTNVPLVVRYPARVPAAARVADWVSLRHLPATLLDLADVVPARPLAGTSLAALWSGGEFPAEPILTQLDMWTGPGRRAVLEDGLRYHLRLQGGKRTEELYDLRTDPLETTDVASDPAYADALARLRARLAESIPDPPRD